MDATLLSTSIQRLESEHNATLYGDTGDIYVLQTCQTLINRLAIHRRHKYNLTEQPKCFLANSGVVKGENWGRRPWKFRC